MFFAHETTDCILQQQIDGFIIGTAPSIQLYNLICA